MKNLNRLPIALVATLYLLLFTLNSTAQNIGINVTGATPDNSALLDLSSTDKGFLITRVDTASIASPAFGLMTLAPIDSCLYMFSGVAWISLGGVGCNCSTSSESTDPEFPCEGTVIPVVEVTSLTGEIWMDRNLGADQVATSFTDADAYGDLFQWGRCSDGHEKRTSATTTTLSTIDNPGHGDFILTNSALNDWRTPQNDNLWQGAAGTNNPCPTGYRLPTQSEFEAEESSWTSSDAAGAIDSPLKLPRTGFRKYGDGSISFVGNEGYYWTSTVSGTDSRFQYIESSVSAILTWRRAYGYAVRCIKD